MRRRELLAGIGAGLVCPGAGGATPVGVPSETGNGDRDGPGPRYDHDPESLRSIAESMDGEKPARRLRGNGPPFADGRPEPYDPADLTYPTVAVGPDEDGFPNPPDSLVVRGGPVDLKLLDRMATYDGIRYLGIPLPRPWHTLQKDYDYTGERADSNYTGDNRYAGDKQAKKDVKTAMYRYNLLFSHRNAYDLGMVNRTADNGSVVCPAEDDPDEDAPCEDYHTLEAYTDKGIVESHRFREGGEDHRSLRNVVERHQQGVRHRVLWQNAKIPFNAPGGGDEQKAKALGRWFADTGYDVVGLCEVYDDILLEAMEDAYGKRYDSTDREYGFPTLYDLGVLLGEQHASESRVRRRLGDGNSDRFQATGPIGGASVNIEGYQRVPVHVPELPGTPAFELWVTHFQGAGSGLEIDDKGEDAKQHAKLDQLDELTTLIEEFQSGPNNDRPIVLMGDFNVHSKGSGGQFDGGSGVEGGQYYSDFMHAMQSVGMQEAWLTHGSLGGNCRRDEGSPYCRSFVKTNERAYYNGNRLDYVFVERPRERHGIHLDLSRLKTLEFPKENGGEPLSDHLGFGFELLTSPAD